ncbi:sensor histidine kinase [Rapidithrix thailandica]|uniref:histidine kinase n=1 Tax=Rapidithrix thailandica TaxID=413964 RepID=A0AAW9S5X3_9BACT
MSKQNVTYKIRPAARLIHTIGSDLIGDSYAALVELVKNAYDADADQVNINFNYKKVNNEDALIITVVDDGHGMNFETVVNKWLVPATNDKLKRKVSPYKKRFFQGRKGIGRFAASILGQEMTLLSVDKTGEKSTAVIDWRVFKTDDFLENIELLLEKQKTDKPSGTTIEIIAKDEPEESKISVWDKTSIEKLINELRKLISPFKDFEKDIFKINLSFNNCPIEQFNDREFDIETYEIIKFYDYRISGSINSQGNANLIFENNVLSDSKQSEKIVTHYNLENGRKYCGDIDIDLRVFDREPEAIDNLINKGLIDPVSEEYAGKNEAKRLLNEAYGVNIYKNQFRIRPYGNGGVDWLDLDKERIQNPTLRISNNQIVGFITIQPEELSRLEEKSARDGLKENEYYFGLKELAQKALKELELRRFTFRMKSLKSRGRNTLQNNISDLFSFSDLSKNIEAKLEQFKVGQENIDQIKSILKTEEQVKAGLLKDIQKTISIYQGQATLGKIVTIILHEGRKPIHFFNTEAKVIERYIRYYKKTKEEKSLEELDESIDGFRRNSKLISDLFKRVNPLANQRRSNKKNFNICEIISNAWQIFKKSAKDTGIEFILDCDEQLIIFGWEEDLFTCITNLIENSIYWLTLTNQESKTITIKVSDSDKSIKINFKDNGPGLTDDEIESDVIFEPGYTKKHSGTGLGLAIAGEAVGRLNGKLTARKSETGAYFQIEIDKI